MKALNIKFGIALAAAAMLSVAAFANDGAVGFNKGHNNVMIEVHLGGGSNHMNMAEMKADEMRRALRLSARTYREVLNFYRNELRFGAKHIDPMREEAAMRRILTGREFRMWKEIFHKGHKTGPGMGPKGPAHGRF